MSIYVLAFGHTAIDKTAGPKISAILSHAIVCHDMVGDGDQFLTSTWAFRWPELPRSYVGINLHSLFSATTPGILVFIYQSLHFVELALQVTT